MSDTKVIDTKLALAWMLPLCITIISGLGTLIWMASQQSSTITSLVEAQKEMKAQMSARDQRDEGFRASQSSAIAEIRLNDSRQDIRLDNLERAVGVPAPLGRWAK